MSFWALYVIEKEKQRFDRVVILGKIEAKYGSLKREEVEQELAAGGA